MSEAYFARLLGLPFVAVMPAATCRRRSTLIEFQGGRCHLVDDPSAIYDEAHRLAGESGGHYMDQFTYAERATDWRGNNNIAESIFEQLAQERHPVPTWVVVGAGTGGTSATIGRFVRYRRYDTQVCVVDPENSCVLRRLVEDRTPVRPAAGSRIEGIGRPRVEPSFLPTVVDAMIRCPTRPRSRRCAGAAQCRPDGRRLDRHGDLGRAAADRRDARRRHRGQRGHAAVRRR